MLKEISYGFYLFDDKLLYVSRDFIGYNPAIKDLNYKTPDKLGTEVKVDEFEMRGSSFKSILTTFFDCGPYRGYTRIEIIKNGRKIIQYERGGSAFGMNYTRGKDFFVEADNGYLITRGNYLKSFETDKIYNDFNVYSYYFLWFTNSVIPTKTKKRVVNYDSLPEKEIYEISEIEHLRQVIWHGKIIINNHEIDISESSIRGFFPKNFKPKEEFIKSEDTDEVKYKLKFVIDGVNSMEKEL